MKACEAMLATDLGRAIADGDLAKLNELGFDSPEAAHKQAEAELNPAGGRIIDFSRCP